MVPRPEVRYLWYTCGSLGGFVVNWKRGCTVFKVLIKGATCGSFFILFRLQPWICLTEDLAPRNFFCFLEQLCEYPHAFSRSKDGSLLNYHQHYNLGAYVTAMKPTTDKLLNRIGFFYKSVDWNTLIRESLFPFVKLMLNKFVSFVRNPAQPLERSKTIS